MSDDTYLDGQLLIAMPVMDDARFERSVIFICAHSDEGAMGLVINQQANEITFPDLLERLGIVSDLPDAQKSLAQIPIHVGGPVETGRGFVLHSRDYFVADSTLSIRDGICLTATVDILKAMAHGSGPDQALLTLGYAGWSPGQLEREIQANGWLNCPADNDLVFGGRVERKYDAALNKLGIDPSFLVNDAGHG
ncbi:MAG: YqgE/AlgH family protein [Pseudomonadota bacterium]